jgi:thioesterase domain-containing protein
MGDSEQSTADEQSNDLSAARSAGVEAAELAELHEWLCQRNEATQRAMSYHQYVEVSAVRDLENFKRVAVHLLSYLNILEQPVRPDEGREAADAG